MGRIALSPDERFIAVTIEQAGATGAAGAGGASGSTLYVFDVSGEVVHGNAAALKRRKLPKSPPIDSVQWTGPGELLYTTVHSVAGKPEREEHTVAIKIKDETPAVPGDTDDDPAGDDF